MKAVSFFVWLLFGSVVVDFALAQSIAAADARLRDAPTTQHYEIGVVVSAPRGACSGIVATLPVPMNWPEQQVRIVGRDVSPQVRRVSYRTLDDGVKLMVVSIPRLSVGQTATAVVTFEVTKSPIAAPLDIESFVLPESPPRSMAKYLRPSPYIESDHKKIRMLAEQIVQGKSGDAQQVEAIYDWVRENVAYQFDVNLKGALTALQDGRGDCEELTSLFIALCRANKIPARAVWVPGHCYAEFYLQDQHGAPRWLPCQAAGERDFGGIREDRPILQKGDSVRLPGQRKPQRYAAPTLTAKNVVANPEVQWVQRPADAP